MTTRVFEIWQYAGKVYGNERNHLPPSKSIRGFEYSYDLRGKSAHFIVVTHDSNLSRDAAIQFAAAIHNGKFSSKRIDFSEHNRQVAEYAKSYVKKGKK